MDKKLFEQELYDEDYFENGPSTGKSCYENYRWLPDLTLDMAKSIVNHLNLKNNQSVLDYGCSKGFLVKALRILQIDSYGCDISEYAIENLDSEIKDYCKLIKNNNILPFNNKKFDWMISKDVLEHISVDNIDILLSESRSCIDNMFHVIPLGNKDGNFIIPEYHDDPTHITIHDKNWWVKKFIEHGWELTRFDYSVSGIKQNWCDSYEKGNGFFIFRKI